MMQITDRSEDAHLNQRTWISNYEEHSIPSNFKAWQNIFLEQRMHTYKYLMLTVYH